MTHIQAVWHSDSILTNFGVTQIQAVWHSDNILTEFGCLWSNMKNKADEKFSRQQMTLWVHLTNYIICYTFIHTCTSRSWHPILYLDPNVASTFQFAILQFKLELPLKLQAFVHILGYNLCQGFRLKVFFCGKCLGFYSREYSRSIM